MCAKCDKNKPPRIEHVLRPEFVARIGMDANTFDEYVGTGGGCGDTGASRPDMTWVSVDDATGTVLCAVVEVDEDSHSAREPQCEAGRMSSQFIALQQAVHGRGAAEMRVLFLRFNPHGYDGATSVPRDDRIEVVAADARRFLFEGGWREHEALCPSVAYYFYHSRGHKHIDYVKQFPDAMRVVKVAPDAYEPVATTTTTSSIPSGNDEN